jgi:DNA-binding SARP family transcriptional activator
MTSASTRPPAFLLRTLGAAELWSCDALGHPHERLLGAGKPLALLAYCCSVRDRVHPRDHLASLLWGDTETSRARQSLRQALWRLRRLVGEHLRTRDDAVLGVDTAIATDRDQFLSAVHRANAPEALHTYRGPFLSGLTAPGGDDFEDWAALERRQLEEALLRTVEPYAQSLLHSGRPAHACEVVERVVSLAPDSLESHRIAVEVLLAAHERVAARRVADTLETLARALGGRAPSMVESLVARARDVALSNTDDAISPLALDLVGREGAFGAVMSAWQRARTGDTQIAVLSGVPGIGKSRLLHAVMQRCATRRSLATSVRANPGEREVPFGFAAAIARALAALPGAAGVSGDTARELVALDPGLGSQFAVSPSLDDGGEAVRRRALALLDLLSAVSEQSPLALGLDDLHWADAASRQLLAVVLGRATELAVLVVATTRGTTSAIFDQRSVIALPLLPLERDQVVDAIRSSGNWADTSAVARFIDMMSAISEGIPLSVMERLEFARDRGLLTLHRGVWASDDWELASREIAVASPLDQRLSASSSVERAALLALAVAGTPLPTSIIARVATATSTLRPGTSTSPAQRTTPPHALPATERPPVLAALEQLEVKSLVVRAGDSWLPSHDVIAERSLALSTPDVRSACHRLLGAAFADGAGPDGAGRAVRHFLLGDDDTRAGQQLARVVARARAMGDHRAVRELLIELIGERLAEPRLRTMLRQVPIWHRTAAFRARAIAGTLMLITFGTVLTAWQAVRTPALTITQWSLNSILTVGSGALRVDADVFGPLVRNTVPSVMVSVRAAAASRRWPSTIRVRALGATTKIVAGDSAPVVDGVASFNRLRFLSTDSISTFRFEADGFRSVDISVVRAETQVTSQHNPGYLRLVGGVLAGHALRSASGVITVHPHDSIRGVVEMEYSSELSAASVWLSMTPTWGDPRVEGHDLAPVATPAQRELLKFPLALRAPREPGHYWILYTLAAEPSGGFALSQTNWSVEHAVWNDGNDIAALPDSSIRLANTRGFIETWFALPDHWDTHGTPCKPPNAQSIARKLKYCQHRVIVFGIEVLVKA